MTGAEFSALIDKPTEDLNQKAHAATERAKAIQDRNPSIVAAVLNGATYGQAAQAHGVSSSLVHEVMIPAGYKQPSKGHAERDAASIAALRLWLRATHPSIRHTRWAQLVAAAERHTLTYRSQISHNLSRAGYGHVTEW